MKRQTFDWKVGFMKDISSVPEEWVPAQVPGAVQLDYGRAHNYKPYYVGRNFEQYHWMEDVFWLYETPLSFELQAGEKAWLVFKAIDYKYAISVDDSVLLDDEGMFSEIRLDVTRFSGGTHTLRVMLYPVPKADDSDCRDQARASVKSAACYGWDWHPRLVTSGIWDEAFLETGSEFSIESLDVSYVLSDDLKNAQLTIQADTSDDGPVSFEILSPSGASVLTGKGSAEEGEFLAEAALPDPELWHPHGYGPQPLYTIVLRTLGPDGMTLCERTRRCGFRRVQLVMNEGSWKEPANFPKSRSDAPITLKQNGRRIFCKGSNIVCARIFPGEMTKEIYERLLTLVKDAHMNLLRIWGGGFINKESFYDLCDEMGIMVWQEFPLACNEYPDDDDYLRVLKKEALSIIRRLRTHPCLALYCGGNELFNVWSRMTDQHHALRLLDSLTYAEDRFTPYIMTAPLNGMAHGSYSNYIGTEECMQLFARSHNTAYTEFGCGGVSDVEQLKMQLTEEDFENLKPGDPNWIAHHNFSEWRPGGEIFHDVNYYFGGYDTIADLSEKSQFLQAMSYRSCFEEMRRQWPHCSMALNWCFNEAWPMICSLGIVSFPDKPRPSYFAVKEALRDRMLSLKVPSQRFDGGSEFTGEIWVLNDSCPEALHGGIVKAELDTGSGYVLLGEFPFREVPRQTNVRLGAVSGMLPNEKDGFIKVRLSIEGREEMDSEYTYVLRGTRNAYVPGTFLNS